MCLSSWERKAPLADPNLGSTFSGIIWFSWAVEQEQLKKNSLIAKTKQLKKKITPKSLTDSSLLPDTNLKIW